MLQLDLRLLRICRRKAFELFDDMLLLWPIKNILQSKRFEIELRPRSVFAQYGASGLHAPLQTWGMRDLDGIPGYKHG